MGRKHGKNCRCFTCVDDRREAARARIRSNVADAAVLGAMAAGSLLGNVTGNEEMSGMAEGAQAYATRDDISDTLDQATYDKGQANTSES